MEKTIVRPEPVRIGAVLAIILGAIFLLDGAGDLAVASVVRLADLPAVSGLAGFGVGLVQTFFVAMGLVLWIVGALYLVVGYGYWGGIGWARTMGDVLSVFRNPRQPFPASIRSSIRIRSSTVPNTPAPYNTVWGPNPLCFEAAVIQRILSKIRRVCIELWVIWTMPLVS